MSFQSNNYIVEERKPMSPSFPPKSQSVNMQTSSKAAPDDVDTRTHEGDCCRASGQNNRHSHGIDLAQERLPEGSDTRSGDGRPAPPPRGYSGSAQSKVPGGYPQPTSKVYVDQRGYDQHSSRSDRRDERRSEKSSGHKSSGFSALFSNSGSSHSDHRILKDRDRYKQERNDALDDLEDLEGKFNHLKGEWNHLRKKLIESEQSLKDVTNQLVKEQMQVERTKVSADKIETQLNNRDMFLGGQMEDSAINAEFRDLMGRIKTWSTNFAAKADQNEKLGVFLEERLPQYKRVAPGCDTLRDLERMTFSRKQKRLFLRGWASFVMTQYLMRVLPIAETAVLDHWAERNTSELFAKLEDRFFAAQTQRAPQTAIKDPRAAPSTPGIAPREFNDWRAMSANLLSKLYPSPNEFANPNVDQAVEEVMSVIEPWVDAQLLSVLKQDLHDIFAKAVEFSRTLRKQRAYWSLRFPGAPVAANGPSKLMYDPDTMVDEFGNHEDFSGDQLRQKSVDFVVGPALFKRGNLDGQKFDVEFAAMPATVVMHEDDEA